MSKLDHFSPLVIRTLLACSGLEIRKCSVSFLRIPIEPFPWSFPFPWKYCSTFYTNEIIPRDVKVSRERRLETNFWWLGLGFGFEGSGFVNIPGDSTGPMGVMEIPNIDVSLTVIGQWVSSVIISDIFAVFFSVDRWPQVLPLHD